MHTLFATRLAQHARNRPGTAALAMPGREITYAKLQRDEARRR
jgi:hypothetical protein